MPNLAALSDLLKVTQVRLQDNIRKRTKLYDMLRRSSRAMSPNGKYWTWPVYLDRDYAGVGARALSGNVALPEGTDENPPMAQLESKAAYGSITIPGAALRNIQKNRDAFVDILQDKKARMTVALSQYLNLIFYGTGNGVLGQVNKSGGYTAATSIILDSNRNMRVGMKLDFYDSASFGTRQASGIKVTAVSSNGTTITVDTPITVGDNAVLVFYDTVSSGSFTGPMGISGIVDDGTNLVTLQNISSSTYPEWKSYVFFIDSAGDGTGTAAQLTDLYLDRGRDWLADHTGDDEQDTGALKTILTTPDVWRDYTQTLTTDRQVRPADYKGGGVATYAGQSPVLDKTAPANTVFLLSESSVEFFSEVEGQWIEDDKGAAMIRSGHNDRFLADWVMQFNLGTMSRYGVRIGGVREDTGYVISN